MYSKVHKGLERRGILQGFCTLRVLLLVVLACLNALVLRLGLLGTCHALHMARPDQLPQLDLILSPSKLLREALAFWTSGPGRMHSVLKEVLPLSMIFGPPPLRALSSSTHHS